MKLVHVIILVTLCSGCAPTLYLIDRPTMLEEQAAGEWHDLEKATEIAILRSKPEALAPSMMGRGGERVLKALPGEPLVSPQSAKE
jgi:hypothetical protein